MKLPLVFSPQPEGGYTVTCPLIPELITEGETPEEAMANVKDALQTAIEIYEDLGKVWPLASQEASGESPIWFEALVSV